MRISFFWMYSTTEDTTHPNQTKTHLFPYLSTPTKVPILTMFMSINFLTPFLTPFCLKKANHADILYSRSGGWCCFVVVVGFEVIEMATAVEQLWFRSKIVDGRRVSICFWWRKIVFFKTINRIRKLFYLLSLLQKTRERGRSCIGLWWIQLVSWRLRNRFKRRLDLTLGGNRHSYRPSHG